MDFSHLVFDDNIWLLDLNVATDMIGSEETETETQVGVGSSQIFEELSPFEHNDNIDRLAVGIAHLTTSDESNEMPVHGPRMQHHNTGSPDTASVVSEPFGTPNTISSQSLLSSPFNYQDTFFHGVSGRFDAGISPSLPFGNSTDISVPCFNNFHQAPMIHQNFLQEASHAHCHLPSYPTAPSLAGSIHTLPNDQVMLESFPPEGFQLPYSFFHAEDTQVAAVSNSAPAWCSGLMNHSPLPNCVKGQSRSFYGHLPSQPAASSWMGQIQTYAPGLASCFGLPQGLEASFVHGISLAVKAVPEFQASASTSPIKTRNRVSGYNQNADCCTCGKVKSSKKRVLHLLKHLKREGCQIKCTLKNCDIWVNGNTFMKHLKSKHPKVYKDNQKAQMVDKRC